MLEKQENFIQKVKNKIDGKNMKYFIFTMGCQLNENDSEKQYWGLRGVIPDFRNANQNGLY